MFKSDHGSIDEQGPNPGNWEAVWPIELDRTCSSVVVSYV